MQEIPVAVLLRCSFLLQSGAEWHALKETARRRRGSPCYVLVFTLSALFVGFVAVPVAADAVPAGLPSYYLVGPCVPAGPCLSYI